MDRIKAAWAIGGIIISIVSAIVTSTIYVNGLLKRIEDLETNLSGVRKAINGQVEGKPNRFTYNSGKIARCGNGSIIVGITISSDLVGDLYCADINTLRKD